MHFQEPEVVLLHTLSYNMAGSQPLHRACLTYFNLFLAP